jgi:mono/diheme cytochrome c family protein
MHKFLRSLVAGVFLAGCWLTAQNLAVTDVQGESWLNHLARGFNETSMGKTGRLGPSEPMLGDSNLRLEPQPLPVLATQPVTVRGADLYRVNCRGCHGELGLGAPPEINSVINPVRSTSIALVMARMKMVGMDVSPATATQMAKQSKAALLLRLHQGGQDMPAFPHLSEPEIGALTAYLKQLAGVPGAEREQVTLRVSRVRVGEHIAKSTCHICHSASGANPNPQQIMEGAIPPLSSLTARKDLSGFVGKVTEGAPVLMGTPPLLCRGRMPVFGYLSEDEAEDVYLYLTLHPPRTPTSATVSASLIPVGSTPPGGASPVNGAPPPGGAGQEDPQPISLMRFAVFPIVLFLFLGGVMARYLPLLAKVRRDDEIISIPLGAPVVGQATVPNVELRGEGAPAMRSSIDLDQAP